MTWMGGNALFVEMTARSVTLNRDAWNLPLKEMATASSKERLLHAMRGALLARFCTQILNATYAGLNMGFPSHVLFAIQIQIQIAYSVTLLILHSVLCANLDFTSIMEFASHAALETAQLVLSSIQAK